MKAAGNSLVGIEVSFVIFLGYFQLTKPLLKLERTKGSLPALQHQYVGIGKKISLMDSFSIEMFRVRIIIKKYIMPEKK